MSGAMTVISRCLECPRGRSESLDPNSDFSLTPIMLGTLVTNDRRRDSFLPSLPRFDADLVTSVVVVGVAGVVSSIVVVVVVDVCCCVGLHVVCVISAILLINLFTLISVEIIIKLLKGIQQNITPSWTTIQFYVIFDSNISGHVVYCLISK